MLAHDKSAGTLVFPVVTATVCDSRRPVFLFAVEQKESEYRQRVHQLELVTADRDQARRVYEGLRKKWYALEK